MMAVTTWDDYCANSQVAAHPAPHPIGLDMIDLCCAISGIRADAAYLERVIGDAEDRDEERGPTLRAHLSDLRHLQAELAALIAEAESAQ
jgi:hypothetical protein